MRPCDEPEVKVLVAFMEDFNVYILFGCLVMILVSPGRDKMAKTKINTAMISVLFG